MKSKKELIFLIIVFVLFYLIPAEARTNRSNSSSDFFGLLFFIGTYVAGNTLFYKRFICRGKYANPLTHIIFLLIFIVFLPYTWIYLFILEPILIFLGYKKGKTITSLSQLGISPRDIKELTDLTPILRSKLGFDKNDFLKKTSDLFFQIYDCLKKADLTDVENYISDGVYEEYNAFLTGFEKDNTSLIIEKVELDRNAIVGIQTDNNYEFVYIAISGAILYYKKNKTTNQPQNKYDIPESIEEIWCFARTKNSNNNDWILVQRAPQYLKISKKSTTQNKAFFNQQQIPGLIKLKEKDPNFNIHAIEDKINILFWRINEALTILDSSPIKDFCTEGFTEEFDSTGKIETFTIEPTKIQSIRILTILFGNDGYDRIVAEVFWDGFTKLKSGYKYDQKERSNFILSRKNNTQTDLYNNFQSKYFENNTIAPDSWLLEKVISSANLEVVKLNNLAFNKKSVVSQSYNSQQININDLNYITGEDLLKMSIAIMLADGIIHRNELKAIIDIGNKKGITPEAVKNYIKEIQSQKNPIEYVLNNTKIPKDMTLLLLLVNIAAADGKITDDEASLLYTIADKMGVYRKLLYDMINNAYQNKVY